MLGGGGELVLTKMDCLVQIDATKEPICFDLVSKKVDPDGDRAVQPGIIRFNGKQLVWVRAGQWYLSKGPKGDQSRRPTEFTSTEKNGQILVSLEPCKFWE